MIKDHLGSFPKHHSTCQAGCVTWPANSVVFVACEALPLNQDMKMSFRSLF